MYIYGLGYWSLFCQRQSMVHFGNSSDDKLTLFKGELHSILIRKRATKSSLKIVSLAIT